MNRQPKANREINTDGSNIPDSITGMEKSGIVPNVIADRLA